MLCSHFLFVDLTSWDLIVRENFENGFGIFNDVGTDATVLLEDGQSSVQMSIASTITTGVAFDITKYSKVEVKFTFMTKNFDQKDKVQVELSVDGGVTWMNRKQLKKGKKLRGGENSLLYESNDVWYTASTMYPKEEGDESFMLKFQCNGSAGDKMLYITKVVLLGVLEV